MDMVHTHSMEHKKKGEEPWDEASVCVHTKVHQSCILYCWKYWRELRLGPKSSLQKIWADLTL